MNWSNIIEPSLKSDLDEILQHAPLDFTANVPGHFSEEDLQSLLTKAEEKLAAAIQQHPPHSHAELALLWNRVVTNYHQEDQWGFRTSPQKIPRKKTPKPPSNIASYVRTFLVPTLLLKAAILYFGLKYSQYPDEGYGWGLIAAIVLSLINFSFFLWKTRHDSEEI